MVCELPTWGVVGKNTDLVRRSSEDSLIYGLLNSLSLRGSALFTSSFDVYGGEDRELWAGLMLRMIVKYLGR